jgi:acyl-CoA synthetase (AMP-forming)/AMP-acid ligase II
MLTCGAAPLSKDLILAVHARLGLTVKQAYGLSETTSITHCQVKVHIFCNVRLLTLFIDLEYMEDYNRISWEATTTSRGKIC